MQRCYFRAVTIQPHTSDDMRELPEASHLLHLPAPSRTPAVNQPQKDVVAFVFGQKALRTPRFPRLSCSATRKSEAELWKGTLVLELGFHLLASNS